MSDEQGKERAGEHLNSLAKASSAYLRSAMHQPVEWQEWGEAGFEKAKRAEEPIVLEVSAVWRHGGVVMDREADGSAAPAAIVNAQCIEVKGGGDEGEDLDA